mmetsp:Transcript_9400/g.20015  ORF Transcript_9400/g.20015 Transcript_9400/m.20015 type:complete len:470 (-) Transcript_9400:62-1471(-)
MDSDFRDDIDYVDGEHYGDISDCDRKPSARGSDDEGKSNHGRRGDRLSSADARFTCAICLDSVSNEPVVTRCGHLFCWECLYTWLKPGMLVSEYYAAFGGGPSNNETLGGRSSSRGGLNNFISEMASYNDVSYGQRHNPQRRRCPVCKADCSVDSVIPIYIQVHANPTSLGDDDASSVGVSNGGNQSTQQPPLTQNNPEDQANANLGLRQRRGRCDQSSPQNSVETDSLGICDTPVRRRSHDILSGFDELANPNTAISTENTPVHRNNAGESSQVPSRPAPTSSWAADRSEPSSNLSPSVSRRNFVDSDANAVPAINTSSPFRMVLRPRYQPHSLSPVPASRERGQPTQALQQSGAYSQPHAHYQPGRLTSVLMGFVDSVDNMASSHGQQSDGRSPNDIQPPPVPQLHRSDGGLGGIGRASEQNDTYFHDIPSGNRAVAEDSSLALAREFLSRLLLMLACFVLLCLLLF